MILDLSRNQRKEKRRAALAASPNCIFCGGFAKATTTDHIPSRALFNDRWWPEGFEFPACSLCNSSTRKEEIIIRFMSMVCDGGLSPPSKAELRMAVQGLRNNYPRIFPLFNIPRDKKKNFLNRRNITMYSDYSIDLVPIIKAGHPEVHDALRRFGVKLGCALHFRSYGNILPPDGAIWIKWYSNIQLSEGALSSDFLQMLGQGPCLSRSKRILNDQFSYDLCLDEERKMGLFVAWFRKSFAMVIMTCSDRGIAPDFFDDSWERPFCWGRTA